MIRFHDPGDNGKIIELTDRDAAGLILVLQAELAVEMLNREKRPDGLNDLAPLSPLISIIWDPEGYYEHCLANVLPFPHDPHEFVGNGNDCELCDEGHQFYLHTDRNEEE